MAEGIRITSNASDLIRKFVKLPQKMQAGIVKALKRRLILVEDKVKQGAEIKARRGSGGLLGRLTSYARPSAKLGLDAAIGFRKTKGFPYELAHEFGAQARPGGAMAIPVSSAAKRAGSPRNMKKDLFVPKGTHVLAESLGLKSFRAGKGALMVHYILIKRLPPRLHFRRTVIGESGTIAEAIIEGWRTA